MSSILTYQGGKERVKGRLASMVPAGVPIVSPFLGGGSVEIVLERRGHRVMAADLWEPLAGYWKVLLTRPGDLADRVQRDYYPYRPEWEGSRFQSLYDELPDGDVVGKAAVLFVLSKTVYSGRMFRGTSCKGVYHRQKGYTLSGIENLRRFRAPGLSVEQADFHDFLPRHPDGFVFADPPYPGKEFLYLGPTHHQTSDQPRTFDHEGLARLLRERSAFLLTYSDTEQIRDLYAGCLIEELSVIYGTGGDHSKSGFCRVGAELVIRQKGQSEVEKGLFNPALKI